MIQPVLGMGVAPDNQEEPVSLHGDIPGDERRRGCRSKVVGEIDDGWRTREVGQQQ